MRYRADAARPSSWCRCAQVFERIDFDAAVSGEADDIEPALRVATSARGEGFS
jgi:hypothetical protein